MSSGTNEPEEWERLNLDAMLALGLAHREIVRPIIKLLRSDAPIDRAVRDALADAFENDRPGQCLQFVPKNAGKGSHTGKSLSEFRRDVEIARYVADRIHHGSTKYRALQDAARTFPWSEDTCKKAVDKVKVMDERIAADPGFAGLTPREAESVYWATFVEDTGNA